MIKKKLHAYKTISEVAESLNLVNSKNGSLSTHTLRYWEKEFKQIKPKIFAGNRRYYDVQTIEIIKNIKFLLKDKGMTIQGVKKQLDNDEHFLINTLTSTASDLISLVKNLIEILILSFVF